MSERIKIIVEEETRLMFAEVLGNFWDLDKDSVFNEESRTFTYTLTLQNIEVFLELAKRFNPRYLKVEKNFDKDELLQLVREITFEEFTYFSQLHLGREVIHSIVYRAIEPNLTRNNLPAVLNHEFITDIILMDDVDQFTEKYLFRNFGPKKFEKLKDLVSIILTSKE